MKGRLPHPGEGTLAPCNRVLRPQQKQGGRAAGRWAYEMQVPRASQGLAPASLWLLREVLL